MQWDANERLKWMHRAIDHRMFVIKSFNRAEIPIYIFIVNYMFHL